MTLVLAPYNDSMRLGQGFNSYTHELCIDNAVTYDQKEVKSEVSPAQTVSYYSRRIKKLSDIVDSLNISPSNAIKQGTIEVNGDSSMVDENTIKDSDITFVVSVKVTNQTTILNDTYSFQKLGKIEPGSDLFNQVYGDSFISGFTEGGNLTGVVSLKVHDEKKKSKKIAEITSAFNAAPNGGLVLESFDGSQVSSLRNKLAGTECTINVSWMGGGQVKPAETEWDIDTLCAAAAAFPARVAECPQRTWAILTKYKANRKFIEAFDFSVDKVLQYDQISAFTSALFDDFMDYKVLLRTLQNIIVNKDSYQIKDVDLAIGPYLPILLDVKSALRNEQSKIVEAVAVLSKDPDILKRQASDVYHYGSEVVEQILEAALRNRAGTQVPVPENPSAKKNTGSSDGSDHSEVVLVDKPTSSDKRPGAPVKTSATPEGFDFESLVPPEIWGNLLPELKKDAVPNPLLNVGLNGSTAPTVLGPPAQSGSMSQTIDTLTLQLEEQKKATQKAEADTEAANAKAKTDADAAQKTISDLNKDLADQKAQVADRKTQLDTANTELSGYKDLAGREVDLANKLQEIVNGVIYSAAFRRDRVEIFEVVYGGLSLRTYHDVGDRLLDFANNKTQFILTGGATGVFQPHDPLVNVVKSSTIVYRYDGKGPLKYLSGTERGNAVSFDPFP